MPKLSFLASVGKAIKDEETKKQSFIDVFSNILVPKSLDSTVEAFSVVGRLLDVEAGDFSGKVSIVDPDNHEIGFVMDNT